MMNFFVGGVFVVILFALANPFMLYMPTAAVYGMLGVLAVAAAVYAGAVFREEARDEREESLRARAARFGYLAGLVILTVDVCLTTARGGHADVWILAALAAMVLVRLAARAFED